MSTKHFAYKQTIFLLVQVLSHLSIFTKHSNLFANYKFECLVYKMLFIRALKPNLNVQWDSIRAKVFSYLHTLLC